MFAGHTPQHLPCATESSVLSRSVVDHHSYCHLQAVAAGSAAISEMCSQLEAWALEVGKPKRQDRVRLPEGLEQRVRELAGAQLEEAYR